MIGLHCDAKECDTWQREKPDIPVEMFTVIGNHAHPGTLHFCSTDCILRFYAQFEPGETRDL